MVLLALSARAAELFDDVEVERRKVGALLETETALAARDDFPTVGEKLLRIALHVHGFTARRRVAKREAGGLGRALEIHLATARCRLRPGDHHHLIDRRRRLRRSLRWRPAR